MRLTRSSNYPGKAIEIEHACFVGTSRDFGMYSASQYMVYAPARVSGNGWWCLELARLAIVARRTIPCSRNVRVMPESWLAQFSDASRRWRDHVHLMVG